MTQELKLKGDDLTRFIRIIAGTPEQRAQVPPGMALPTKTVPASYEALGAPKLKPEEIAKAVAAALATEEKRAPIFKKFAELAMLEVENGITASRVKQLFRDTLYALGSETKFCEYFDSESDEASKKLFIATFRANGKTECQIKEIIEDIEFVDLSEDKKKPEVFNNIYPVWNTIVDSFLYHVKWQAKPPEETPGQTPKIDDSGRNK